MYNGATEGSVTKTEIGTRLNFESEDCHGILLGDTVTGLTSGGDTEVALASKIFVDIDADIKKEFRKAESTEEVDFSDKAATAEAINTFVSTTTKGFISEIVQESSINEGDILSIVNALFFKGKWANEFDPMLTEVDTFTTGDGIERQVPFMQQDGDFKFARTTLGAFLEMPYLGNRFVMNLFKPTKTADLADYLKKLNYKEWAETLDGASTSEVMVRLPKFEIEASYNLHEILPLLGVKKVFTPTAELRGISSKGAFVSSAVHKAKIIVNEEGTTAAAVTETRVQPLSAPPSFIADEPFMYFITDTANSNMILFMGTVMDPTI